MSRLILCVVFFVLCITNLFAQEEAKKSEETKDFYLKKGKGFEFHFDQDKYMFYIDFRGQFRAAYPHYNFPTNADDFSDDDMGREIE